jgi:hypothetical protein
MANAATVIAANLKVVDFIFPLLIAVVMPGACSAPIGA